MTYYGAKELADSFRTVRKNTVIIAEEIPEAQYGFRAAADSRSVGELLTHIALGTSPAEKIHAIDKLKTLEGFDFPGFFVPLMAKEKETRTKAQIIELLRQEGDRFANWLGGLSDAFLAEQVSLPTGATPASKTRFEMLLSVKEHEMHHRAQVMLIERMLGMVPHLTREMEVRIAAMMSQSKATA
jgi:uncharacterized damage-inducible protein DinB